MLERRDFLKSGTAALIAAGSAPVWLFSGRSARSAAAEFTRAQFEALVGSRLYVDGGPSSDALELIEVRGYDAAPDLEQWDIVLRGDPGLTLEEGTHTLTPELAEAFTLHLQPAGADESASYYTASFGHVRPLPSCTVV